MTSCHHRKCDRAEDLTDPTIPVRGRLIALTWRFSACGRRICALIRDCHLAVVALGELLQVQQLPPGHDQVADS